MKNIFIIAKSTFKETLRDRILYGIIAFALLFLLSTILFGSLSLGEDIKVIKDLGLAGIYLFSVIIAIFVSSSVIYKEIESRIIRTLLARPVSMIEYLIGKYLGLLSSIILTVLLMTVSYLIIVLSKGGGFDYASLFSALLLIFELALLVALSMLFSSFTTPLATTIYSIIILFIGHSLSLLTTATSKSGGFSHILANVIYYILPNLEKFNLRNLVVYGTMPSSSQIIYPMIYSVCFSAILLWLTNIALKKQDL